MNDRSSRSHSIFTIVVENAEVDEDGESAQPADNDGGGAGGEDGGEGAAEGGDSATVAEGEGSATAAVHGKRDTRFTSSRCHFVDLAGSERAKASGNQGQ